MWQAWWVCMGAIVNGAKLEAAGTAAIAAGTRSKSACVSSAHILVCVRLVRPAAGVRKALQQASHGSAGVLRQLACTVAHEQRVCTWLRRGQSSKQPATTGVDLQGHGCEAAAPHATEYGAGCPWLHGGTLCSPVVPLKMSTTTSLSVSTLSSIARRSRPFLRRRNTACMRARWAGGAWRGSLVAAQQQLPALHSPRLPPGKSPGSLPTSRSLLLAMRSIFTPRPSTANDKMGLRLDEGAVPPPSARGGAPSRQPGLAPGRRLAARDFLAISERVRASNTAQQPRLTARMSARCV